MDKEIIAEYTYELPEPTDEEIRKVFEAEGITDVNPDEVRDCIRTSIYLHMLYCKETNKNKTD